VPKIIGADFALSLMLVCDPLRARKTSPSPLAGTQSYWLSLASIFNVASPACIAQRSSFLRDSTFRDRPALDRGAETKSFANPETWTNPIRGASVANFRGFRNFYFFASITVPSEVVHR